MGVEVRRSADALELTLSGEWGARQFNDLDGALHAVEVAGARRVAIDARGIGTLDLTGAWALHQFVARARAAGAEVAFAGSAPDQLRLLDETLKEADRGVEALPPPAPAGAAHGPVVRLLVRVGRRSVAAAGRFRDGLAFVGRSTVTAFAATLRPKHLRPISVARHVYDTGITALPIVSLIAFLISVIIAYMSATQLRGLGADIYVVDLV